METLSQFQVLYQASSQQKHALGIVTEAGLEMMVHIGLFGYPVSLEVNHYSSCC